MAAKRGDVSDPASSQALAAEEADLYLGLIQPASMFGRVVNRKSIPQPSAGFFAKAVHQRLAGVGAQVIHDQMDGVGSRIVLGDREQKIGKLGRRAGGCYFGEMNSRLRFDAAEDVGCAAALVLIISSRDLTGPHRNRGPRIFMQHRRLFVDANHGFALRQRLFVGLEHVLHLVDVLLVQLPYAPHFFPAMA